MSLKLVKAGPAYEAQIKEMLREWRAYNQAHPEANTSPWAIFKHDEQDFEQYLAQLEHKEAKNGFVPDSVWFCLEEERNRMVGAVNIRHYLNDYLLRCGGHIGDGIRPSERRKGYATAMIGLALEECRRLGIDRVLLVCDKRNIGSAKSIINNGGRLENEVEEDGKIMQRYWIELEKA